VAACKPQVVIETVEKIVKETVVVEGEEKVVEKIVEVEKEVEAVSYSGELRAFIAAGAPVEPVHELLATSLMARFPDVTVKFEYIVGDMAEQMYTRAAAGTLADVVHSADLFCVPFAYNDVTLDLGPWLEVDPVVDLDDVFESMLGLGTFEGEIHMLPSALDVVTMYYNKTMMEDAGAELPADTWTWDDFTTQMKKVVEMETDAQGIPVYWGLTNQTWNWWATVYPWIVGYGGEIRNEDKTQSTWSSEAALAGLRAYTELWTEHNIALPLGLDVGGGAFELGRAAVWTHIQGLRPHLKSAIEDKFEWDVQVMPIMPDGRHRTGMGTWGISVYSGSQNRDLAYEYVKGIVTPAIQRLLAQRGESVPLLRSVAEDPSWYEGLQPPPTNFMAYVRGADDAVLPIVDYPADCGSFYTGLVNQSYIAALEAAIRGQRSVEDAFAECDEDIQRCLDDYL
jgi:ABC-type glycerol-3-phosphate transport system substrate-binding protein